MRKWQDLAAPDDQGSWFDVDALMPTLKGTYENSTRWTLNTATATGVSTVVYAFAARTLTGTRQFAIDAAHIWEYSSGVATDQTGGVTVGTLPMMAQYGSVTLCVMGAANPTVKSTGAAFSALAGAPKGEIVCVHKNAVLIFNTDTSADGWAASDVGDYTNWTTGEAASGRLIDTIGPITAAIPFGDAVYVFKTDAIYRMTYIGGVVKWAFQLIWAKVGCGSFTANASKYAVAVGPTMILFEGQGLVNTPIYMFDGSSPPQLANPLTTIGADLRINYDPVNDRFSAFNIQASGAVMYTYSPKAAAWGKDVSTFATSRTSLAFAVPCMGDYQTIASTFRLTQPPMFFKASSADTLGTTNPIGGTAVSAYAQTSMLGRVDQKTLFSRVTPRLHRYTGSNTPTLDISFYHELHDAGASSTQTVTMPALGRRRFEFTGADNFARFKVTYPTGTFEIDDFMVAAAASSKE